MGACSTRVCPSVSTRDSQGAIANWELLKCCGEIPCGRSGQSVVVYKRKAFLFGGFGGEIPAHLSDFYSYDFDSSSWRQILASGNCPCPRTALTMCATPDGFIYVWGGTGQDLQGFEEHQLNRFDILHNRWSSVPPNTRTILNTRYFGRTCTYYNSSLFFFGGGMKGGLFTNELISYDLKNNQWVNIQTSGDSPCPRYKHTACIVQGTLYVIGGGCYLPTEETIDLYALCLRTFVWKRIEAFGKLPPGRVAHTCEYDPISNVIYLWGGFDLAMCPLSDFYTLDLCTFKWSTIFGCEILQYRRSFHSSCFFDGGLYSFNGSDGENRYADLIRFQIYHTPKSLKILSMEGCCWTKQDINEARNLPQELQAQFKYVYRDSVDAGQLIPFS